MRTALTTMLIVTFAVAGINAHEGEHHDAVPASDEHAVLQQDVGVWDAEMKMWMAPEGGEPMPAKGVEENVLMAGGSWLLSDFEGNFGGQDFTGRGQFGYDPQQQKYIGTWVDSMSPYMMTMKGTYDADSKTLTMFGENTNPQTGQPMYTKAETRYVSDNERVMTMYMGGEDKDDEYWKHMEIRYTRRSS